LFSNLFTRVSTRFDSVRLVSVMASPGRCMHRLVPHAVCVRSFSITMHMCYPMTLTLRGKLLELKIPRAGLCCLQLDQLVRSFVLVWLVSNIFCVLCCSCHMCRGQSVSLCVERFCVSRSSSVACRVSCDLSRVPCMLEGIVVPFRLRVCGSF
jgi:hypothetical protein